jgi:predicted DNA-binding protein (UPF0251 family)
MPRPKRPRFVSEHPVIQAYVPEGIFPTGEISLSVEELEAIRMSDVEKLDQETAAEIMDVSRQTYGRILNNARSIIGNALVFGKVLRIGGGNYEIRGQRRHRKRGMGRRPF